MGGGGDGLITVDQALLTLVSVLTHEIPGGATCFPVVKFYWSVGRAGPLAALITSLGNPQARKLEAKPVDKSIVPIWAMVRANICGMLSMY